MRSGMVRDIPHRFHSPALTQLIFPLQHVEHAEEARRKTDEGGGD